MNTIKRIEQILELWKAAKTGAFKDSNLSLANMYRFKIQGIETALEILQRPPNTQLKLGGLKCLASPCPCTAIKMNQCNVWCRFYPPTT